MKARGPAWLWHLLLWTAALAVGLTALRTSLATGRLSQDSTYDDVGYLIDGLQRVRLLHADGVSAFASDLVRRPPHSAFSTGLAIVGFLAFGEHDWAPYVANLLLVAGSLYLLATPFRQLGGWLPSLAPLALATVPLLQTAVIEFRPDYAVGLATAGFCALLVPCASRAPAPQDVRWGWAGVVLGLALLAKPPFLPHTLLLAGAMAGAIVVAHRGLRLFSRAWWNSAEVRGAARFLATGAVVALPYYAVNGAHVVEYFRTNTFSGRHAELWRVDGGHWGALRFFTIQPPVAEQLGFWFWVFLAVVVAGLVAAAWRRQWRSFGETGLLAGAAALSLAVLVLGRHANQFFAVTFQLLLATAACRTVARWADPLHPQETEPAAGVAPMNWRQAWRRRLLGGGLTGLALWQATLATPPTWFPLSPEARPPLDVNRKILAALARESRESPAGAPPQVFLALAGSVSAPTLEWLALKARQPALFFDAHRAFDLGELLDNARSADFVVIGAADDAAYLAWLPANRLQTQLRTALLAEGFQLKERFPTSGPPIDLLEAPNHRATQRSDLSATTQGATGFLDPEGPFPQWRLGRVQWGLYPESAIPLGGEGPRRITLHGSVRCESGRRIEGRVNGRSIGEHRQVHSGFESFAWTFDATAADRVLVLVYESAADPKASIPRAALFRELRLETAP